MNQHAAAAPQKTAPKKAGRAPAPPAPESVDAVSLAQSWESVRGALRPGTVSAPGDPPVGRAPASVQRSCACGGTCKDCREDRIGIRTKVRVGPPGDAYEREADSVAARVLGLSRAPLLPSFPAPAVPAPAIPGPAVPEPGLLVPPGGAELPSRSRLRPGRPAPDDAPTPPGPADLTRGGSPLPAGLRAYFEPRFGRDLSEVRVHTGPAADAWNDGLDAHAFTYANHVWLGRGHAPAADFLLAHELAHVVQQRQPRALAHPAGTGPGTLSAGGPSIQRLELSDPFWVPLSATDKLTGTDIHKQLLGMAQTNNPKLDIEAPAPNANSKDYGLNYAGSIDLFLGSFMPGIKFDGLPVGEKYPDPAKTTPKKHGRAGMTTPRANRFKPFMKGNDIVDIDQGPTDPKLGELKPATKVMLDKGEAQLTNYDEGLKLAADLTNKWAGRRSLKKEWKLGKPGRLGKGEVDFKLEYDPDNPKRDVPLVLAHVAEDPLNKTKYKYQTLFNPRSFGLKDIMGGLYAQKYNGGKGLWMYFARPASLDEARGRARDPLIKHQMTIANDVQNLVINAVMQPPQKDPPKAAPKISKLARGGGHARPPLAPPDPLPAAPGGPLVQRAPAAPKLKDDFDHKKWKKDQADLRDRISGPGAKEETRNQVQAMEFLHHAYRAEEALNKVPGMKKSKLPGKGSDRVDIVSGTGKDAKTKKKDLSDVGGWLKGWTGKPAAVLGVFRDKFGGAFTTVANKLVDLKEKVKAKLQQRFDSKSGVNGKSGKAKFILLAVGKALKQVAKVLIPRTLHLVLDAVEAGIKKKLEKVFNLDPAALAEETFGKEFRTWNDLLDAYKLKADKLVDDTVGEYAKDLKWIQEVIDLSHKVGPIIEAAVAGVQCASPPVWGCVKLLAKSLTDCALAKVMNICTIQKEIADLTMGIQPLKDLPVDLAKQAMKILKKASPKGLEDIFDEPLAKPPDFDSSEIECEFTPLPSGCPEWGLIGVEGGKGAPPKDDAESKESEEGEADETKPEPKGEKPKPDAGTPKPAPDAGQPQPKPEGGTPQQPDEANRKMEEFLDKLTKEELDELYREAERRGLLDKPFDPKQGEELLKKARKNIKERKAREAKKRAEERARKEREKREAEGNGGKGAEGPGGTKGGGTPGPCVWDSSHMFVGGFVLRGTKDTAYEVLDEGHTHEQPFAQKTIRGCGGLTLTFKNDFFVGSGACPHEGAFEKLAISLEIRHKTATADKLLFKGADDQAKDNGIVVDPSWGHRLQLPSINESGTLEIKMHLDAGSGRTKSISAAIPIDMDCS